MEYVNWPRVLVPNLMSEFATRFLATLSHDLDYVTVDWLPYLCNGWVFFFQNSFHGYNFVETNFTKGKSIFYTSLNLLLFWFTSFFLWESLSATSSRTRTGQRSRGECGGKRVSVDGKCECGRRWWVCLKVFECVVCECECGQIECAVLSVTVPYLGNAPIWHVQQRL